MEEKPGWCDFLRTILLPCQLSYWIWRAKPERMEVLEDPGKCGDVRKLACAPLANTQITTQIGVPPQIIETFPFWMETKPMVLWLPTSKLNNPTQSATCFGSENPCHLPIPKVIFTPPPSPFPSPRKQSSHCCERSNLFLSLSRANGPAHLPTAQAAVIESTGWCGLIPRDYPRSKPGHGKIVYFLSVKIIG